MMMAANLRPAANLCREAVTYPDGLPIFGSVIQCKYGLTRNVSWGELFSGGWGGFSKIDSEGGIFGGGGGGRMKHYTGLRQI